LNEKRGEEKTEERKRLRTTLYATLADNEPKYDYWRAICGQP